MVDQPGGVSENIETQFQTAVEEVLALLPNEVQNALQAEEPESNVVVFGRASVEATFDESQDDEKITPNQVINRWLNMLLDFDARSISDTEIDQDEDFTSKELDEFGETLSSFLKETEHGTYAPETTDVYPQLVACIARIECYYRRAPADIAARLARLSQIKPVDSLPEILQKLYEKTVTPVAEIIGDRRQLLSIHANLPLMQPVSTDEIDVT